MKNHMKLKNHTISPLSLIPAAAGVFFTAGVLTVFSACQMKDDGTFMHCHDAQNAAAVCGAVIAVLFLLSAFVNHRIIRIILNILAAGTSCIAFFIPGTIIPMCMMHTMRCYTIMQPFVRIMAVITAALAVRGIVRALKH